MTKELKKLYALLRLSRLHTLGTHEVLDIGVVLNWSKFWLVQKLWYKTQIFPFLFFCDFVKKQARKGFWPPSAMEGIGYFQKFWGIFRNFSGGFFCRNFLGEFFWEDIFWEDFFRGIFLEKFFGRIFLGGLFLEKF